MNFLKKFLRNEEKIQSYADFWKWFQVNEKHFYKVVKANGNVDHDFFRKLSPKLAELREGYYYLTGMLDEHTVELVFTAMEKSRTLFL